MTKSCGCAVVLKKFRTRVRLNSVVVLWSWSCSGPVTLGNSLESGFSHWVTRGRFGAGVKNSTIGVNVKF